jgi:hypothetical protein
LHVIGKWEASGVTIARANQENHPVSLAHSPFPEVDVVRRPARMELHWRIEADELFKSHVDEAWIPAKDAQLVRIPHERDDAVGDEVRRCLVTRAQQYADIGDGLLVCDRLGADIQLQHRGDEVIARLSASLGYNG